MAVPLRLLLALLGCTAALDLALEEAWEGWKSLYAKEYTRVGPHGALGQALFSSSLGARARASSGGVRTLWCSWGGCS